MKAPLFLALLAACTFPSPTSAQTAEDIMARNIAARGGAENFREIHSMVVRTHEETSCCGIRTFTLRIMRPDRMRFDYSWQGGTMITGFDGQTGWHIELIEGKKKGPTAITASQLEALREQAQNQFEEPLIDPQAKGNKVELLGMETVEGKPCYKVRFTTHTGQVRYAYYDAESFLHVRNDQVVSKSGSKQEKLLTVMISDYRNINGILFAHTFISVPLTSPFASVQGTPLPMAFFGSKRGRTTSTIQAIEINPAMDESVFQTP